MKKFRKHFRYGEKGFTLIELLVVIAILGVLAAVVVPNVSRFMGKGKAEAGLTELHSVVTAVTAMMADRNLTSINATNPYSGSTTTQDMTGFPDSSYPLFGSIRYLQKDTTEFHYTCETDGLVRAWWVTGIASGNEIGIDDPP